MSKLKYVLLLFSACMLAVPALAQDALKDKLVLASFNTINNDPQLLGLVP